MTAYPREFFDILRAEGAQVRVHPEGFPGEEDGGVLQAATLVRSARVWMVIFTSMEARVDLDVIRSTCDALGVNRSVFGLTLE